MQIHELNNFSGTLGSGAYLAIDDGNDTGKISSQGLLAATEARIDNIIAGEAPSAEEIVDARLGADGVTYSSLGTGIRSQFTDVKSAFSNCCGCPPIAFTKNYYIVTSTEVGSTVSLSPVHENGYRYAIVDCAENDVITVNGTGGASPRLWAFIDSSNKMLARAEPFVSGNALELIAPTNASKCIINFSGSSVNPFAFKGRIVTKQLWNLSKDCEGLANKLENLDDDLEAQTTLANCVNMDDLYDDHYYKTDGSLDTSSSWTSSQEYLPIKPSTPYSYASYDKFDSAWKNSNYIAVWYDEHQNFISQDYNNHTFTSPANAKYMRFSITKAHKNYKPIIYENSNNEVPDKYYKYGYISNQANNRIDHQDEILDVLTENSTRFVNMTETVNKYVAITNGTVKSSYFSTGKAKEAQAGETATGQWEYIKVAVSAGKKYRVSSVAGQDARQWKFVDTDGYIITFDSYSGTPAYRTSVVESPNEYAAFLIVNHKYGDDDYLIEEVLPSAVIADHSENPLYGKILCCCGDSITYGDDMDADGFADFPSIDFYQCDSSGVFSQITTKVRKSWGYQIASRNNMTFYNGGVNGSTIQGLADKHGFSLADGRYTKLPDDIDYLLIWFGWNDTAYGTLGAINDATNETYYGAYNVVLPYLINKYPYAKIALIVPYGTDANHREAIRLLGNKWGLAVWDNYQGGTPLYYGKEDSVGVDDSIVTANRAKYQANGAHPNYKGHRQLADMIEDFLRRI